MLFEWGQFCLKAMFFFTGHIDKDYFFGERFHTRFSLKFGQTFQLHSVPNLWLCFFQQKWEFSPLLMNKKRHVN